MFKNKLTQSIHNVYTFDMKSKITKWGNSYGIRIPRALIEKLHLEEKDIEIIEEKNCIKLVPIKKETKLNLKDLVDKITDDNKHELMIETDGPVGKEIW